MPLRHSLGAKRLAKQAEILPIQLAKGWERQWRLVYAGRIPTLSSADPRWSATE